MLCQSTVPGVIALAVFRTSMVLMSFAIPANELRAQSTFGTILGTVTDNSGGFVSKANVKVTSTDENTSRTVVTNSNGDFEFVNMKPGHYKIEVSALGFGDFVASGLALAARQTLRVDARLQVGQFSTVLGVESTSAGVIATDTQTIQSSLDGEVLLSLPGNIRAGGNTSPFPLIAVLPGVQPDDNGNYSIHGGNAAMAEFSLDGISTTSVITHVPIFDAFPSLESIAEIKVQGVGNTAEFGEMASVTTISRSGTNELHGDLFWYHQNRALDAMAFGQKTKPQKVGNDFGASMSGPVLIPGLYNGKNKTFFFGTFEGLRFPQGQTIHNTVPTEALRQGDFSRSGGVIKDLLTEQPFPDNQVPASRISPVAQGFLALYPLPNAGDLNRVHFANYIDNRDASYNTNQYDARVDHYITPKMSIFGRWTWKGEAFLLPLDLLVPSLQVGFSQKLFVFSWNATVRPNLINEFRFGFTLWPVYNTLPFDGVKFTNSLGLEGVGPRFPFNGIPFLYISGYDAIYGIHNSTGLSSTYQWTDNVTWTVGRHTVRIGSDIRRVRDMVPHNFSPGENYGSYNFFGSFSGDPFADFLLGIPHDTQIDNNQHEASGRSVQYAAYAQDAFRAGPKLTFEYGLRWDYDPAFTDAFGNLGNFVPSPAKSGSVIYPDGAQSLLAPVFLQSFNACPAPPANGAPCTPVLSARQAHLPEGLKTTSMRLEPRFGFAYRPFASGKTVVRGGFGIHDNPSLGSIFNALTGTLQSNQLTYINVAPDGGPIFQWPQIRAPGNGLIPPLGTANFSTAVQTHWKDPYTMQWNLSIDRDLGFNTGLRISYIASATRDLVWWPNLNQSSYSKQYYASQQLSSRPFPNWGDVGFQAVGANANYQSGQVEVSHRFRHGLMFNSAYTLAKSLADNQGAAPGPYFSSEARFYTAMDSQNRRGDYGDVSATRRHRWISTAVYDLPFGRGRSLLSHGSRFVESLIGGWRLSNIFLIQTGTYDTPFFLGGDPSGTGSFNFAAQRADRIKSGSLANPTANQWVDPTAFVCPGTPGWTSGQPCTIGSNPGSDLPPLGRFGNSGVGVVLGPGTINLSTGLSKTFAVAERIRLKLEGSFTNVLNHVNLEDPQMFISFPGFGQITSARSSDFGGNRTGQVSARIEF